MSCLRYLGICALPALEELQLSDDRATFLLFPTAHPAAALSPGLSTLRNLDLSGCGNLLTLGHQFLAKVPELRDLSLSDCRELVRVGGPDSLNCIPLLERLDLSGCCSLTEDLEWLGELPSLRSLELSGCQAPLGFQLPEGVQVTGMHKMCNTTQNIMKSEQAKAS